MMRKMCLGAMLLAGAGGAQAACTLSATGVAFGVYNPAATTPKLAGGNVTVDFH
jgi:hypothetical protein